MDTSDEESLKLLTKDMKFGDSEEECETGTSVPEEKETAADEAAETPEQQEQEEVAGTEKHSSEPKSEIAELRKMVEQLLQGQKSQGRSPEHAAFAKAYPHLEDKYQELADKAVQFANDAVGEDHPNWVNVAERFLKHAAESHPKETKQDVVVAKVKGAKDPKGTSVVSKPKPTAKPKSNIMSEEEEIRLLTPVKY